MSDPTKCLHCGSKDIVPLDDEINGKWRCGVCDREWNHLKMFPMRGSAHVMFAKLEHAEDLIRRYKARVDDLSGKLTVNDLHWAEVHEFLCSPVPSMPSGYSSELSWEAGYMAARMEVVKMMERFNFKPPEFLQVDHVQTRKVEGDDGHTILLLREDESGWDPMTFTGPLLLVKS